ncbi:hypothetical protein PG994_001728 [Apiospora phragmitis]|uniref:Uncharacterized protein n=1 Tax=Apiospora phragmitis TaxID=2905665 RepID=A0ABR1WU99_9PEZI
MRFNARNLVLGLATLGSIPEGLGRAVPRTTTDAVSSYKYEGNLHARVVVEPVHVGAGGKGSGGKGGEGEGAGGGKGGNGGKGSTPGGDGGDGDGSPARIGSPDGKGSTGGGNGDKPVHIGAGDKPSGSNTNQNPDIWCRGAGCGGGDSKKPDSAALGKKGVKGIDLAVSPKEGTDYSKRYDNYKFEKEETEGADDSIPALGLKDQGFHEEDGWTTYHISSKGSNADPAAKISYGRVTKDGKEYLGIVAHDRHAEYDGNRYKLTKTGANVEENGKPVLNPDRDTKAVPVSQLVYKGAEEAGVLKKPADKVFLVSENVINDEAKVIIPDALSAVGEKGQSHVFKNGAQGEEGAQFKILAGLDNNYSYLNTVGRNPAFFEGYKLTSIKVVWGDSKAMSMEFDKA